jgi:uncharacterized protein
VNLAGEPLLAGRWSPARRTALWQSRVDATALLVGAMRAARVPPRVLVSASAVGYYGDRGDQRLDETSSPDDSFLSTLCQALEGAAQRAADMGMRVVLLRTGVVLGRDGGALASMLRPFRMGLGGRIGCGEQHLPWIHVRDLVGVIVFAIEDGRVSGPLNGVAPEAATNRAFTRLGFQFRYPTLQIALADLIGEPAD